MPELPEVETICRGLDKAMAGRRIVAVTQNRADLRFPLPGNFRDVLTGRHVVRVSRRAKYILAELTGGLILLAHLGMSGRFAIVHGKDRRAHAKGSQDAGRSAHEAHEHVIFHLDDKTDIVYSDPRRFGFMDIIPEHERDSHPRLSTLGMEPLSNQMNGAVLGTLLAARRTSLKAALMDQKIIAGLGNIYVSEALYLAALSPKRKAATLARGKKSGLARADALAAAIRTVLENAIAAGGSSLRDYARADGELGYFQHAFQVYDREGAGCLRARCKGTVKRIIQNNRSTFFCPACQR